MSTNPRSGNTLVIILLIGVVILVAAGVGGYLWANSKTKTPGTAYPKSPVTETPKEETATTSEAPATVPDNPAIKVNPVTSTKDLDNVSKELDSTNVGFDSEITQ